MLDSVAHLAQASFKKMIGARDQDQLLRTWDRMNQPLQLRRRPELIPIAADKQFRLGAGLKKAEVISAIINRRHWQAQSDRSLHPRIGASRAQAHRRAKRESGKNQGQVKLAVKPIQRGSNVFHFTIPWSCSPWLSPVPRKLKRNTGKPKLFSAFMA